MIEVLKQALEALETEVSIDWTNNDEFNASAEKMHDAITSLQQAIAELESQEPVAWFRYQQGSRVYYDTKKWDDCQPLYTQSASDYERGFIDGMQKQMQSSVDKAVNAMSQRTWVGLTADEKSFVYDQVKQIVDSKPFWVRFADAIEAKLKERNNA